MVLENCTGLNDRERESVCVWGGLGSGGAQDSVEIEVQGRSEGREEKEGRGGGGGGRRGKRKEYTAVLASGRGFLG